MTTLAITPNWKNKSARFKGTVAAGEHVAVTIQNDDGEGGEFIEDVSTLRLRVVDPASGRTLAIFPEPVPEGETPEEWDSDLSPLRCTLNLNTVQMLKSVPPAANVPLLFVLDDYENKTLYFKEQFPVEHWPRLRSEEEPTDLDNYKDIIADFNTRLDGYDTRITAAENVANAATENASAAATKANQAIVIANQAVAKAETAQNSAAASAEAAYDSALAAAAAQEAAESAAESINSPDATLAEEGVAADAKATGERIAAEEARAEAAEAAEESRAKAAESALAANVSSAQKAISDEAELRAAADADLEANKADKSAVSAISNSVSNLTAEVASAQTDIANRYTKSEVDAIVAALKNGRFMKVNSLPESGETMVIYLVPRQDEEEGNVYDEYIWTDGKWEKLGSTDIQLTEEDPLFMEWKGGYSIALGSDADANPDRSTMAIGVLANCEAGNSIALGRNATVAYPLKGYDSASEFPETGAAGIFYVAADTGKMYRWSQPEGSSAYTYVDTGRTIDLDTVNYYKGWFFSANMAIGYDAKVSYDFENGDGEFNPVPTQGAIALGTHTNVTGSFGIAMGYGAEVSGRESVAIGDGAEATHEDAVVIGHNAVSHGDDTVNLHSTALNKIYLGSNTIQDLINAAVNAAIQNQTIAAAVSTTTATGGGRRLLAAATPTSTTKTEVTPADIGAENATNKVTSISAESTDTQYPSAKAVFRAIAGATPNLDYVMQVDPQTGNIYYTTPDANANT